MRFRKQPIGERNIVGKKIEQRRKNLGMKQKDLLVKLKTLGVDLSPSGFSKLEGQLRSVSDIELVALSEALNVSVDWLVGKDNA